MGLNKMKRIRHLLGTMAVMLSLLLMMTASTFAASGANWEQGVIEVEGMGMAPSFARNQQHAYMLAKRAAMADAYRLLAEEIKGVDVDATTTVENMMVSSDVVTTRVNALIKGAKVTEVKDMGGGAVSVVMQMPMFGTGSSLASAVLQRPARVEPYPDIVPDVTPSQPISIDKYPDYTKVEPKQPTYQPTVPNTGSTGPIYGPGSSAAKAPSGRAIGGYTGLIVDCRGFALKPVMSPVIKNAEGTPIYGYKNLDYDKVVSNGMAGYTNDITRAARAGSHPLVVKAIAVADMNGNPVLSVADANRVLIENGATGFLDSARVVFVR